MHNDVAVWRQQAAQQLASSEFLEAAQLYEQLVAVEPSEKSHVWHLGLSLLLDGQEAEAQAAWMLAMVEGTEAKIEQWTADLAAVLSHHAELRELNADAATAWIIRRHLREIVPHDSLNLLCLIELSLQLDTFTAENLQDWDVLPLLKALPPDSIAWDTVFPVLKQLIRAMPLEPLVQQFAEICLLQSPDPYPFAMLLLGEAIELAYNRRQPLVAVEYTKLCLEVYPDDLNLWGYLSYFYQDMRKHHEGIEAARHYCTIARRLPDQIYGAFLMMRALMRAGREWDLIFRLAEHQETLIAEMVQAETETYDATIVVQLFTTTSCLPYVRNSLALNRRTQNQLMQFCQTQVEQYSADRVERYRQGIAARHNCQIGDRPLRIGYLSYCLKQHSVGWLSRWLFQHHDRSQFELYGYFWNSPFGAKDPLQRWFGEQVTHARWLGRDSDEIADRIFEDGIDILIDLDSITADVVCAVMALKPAPVQVTWLGWDASGIPAIDYYIVDSYVVPDDADAHYAEKLWRLPHSYIAVDGFEIGVPTLHRRDLDIPADAVVYWSGQSSYKRHPETVRAQLEIIKAVPGSYFLVKGITAEDSIRDYFTQMAIAVGVEPERLRFIPEVAEEAVHRANLAIADVVLDTYPYNGATTTLETLWMGIPLVTRVGEHFSSRNSYTMMMNAGITEGIAWSQADYIEWGIRLGTNAELRRTVAWKLWQSRQSAPLWNAQVFTREMETAYRQMWNVYTQNPAQLGA